ncbi:acetyl-CoA synthetase-like protein [Testicularia cyperi]|uniref:Acetyl-CoA synthetase-like protein n=1 Tax=Testicularia cyperi TaxID=1882483 RepID=A0A317XKR2_9BASI|nr:acetyl-CoA synthetase-like protein [Testicularia cyperi]
MAASTASLADAPISSIGFLSEAPYEGRACLNALMDDRVREDRDKVFLSVTKSTEPFEWMHLTYGQLEQCVRAATAHYASIVPPRKRGEKQNNVACYALSSLDSFVTELALLRMGHGAALLSPNNSVPALIHLVKTIDADTIIYSSDRLAAVQETLDLLTVDADEGPKVSAHLQFPAYQAIQQGRLDPLGDDLDPHSTEISYAELANDKSITMHSSGSTGFPKPLTYTHEQYMTLISDSVPYDAFCTVPVFHGYGCAVIWRQYLIRRRLYLYSENIRVDQLSEAILKSDATIFHAVPFTYKMMAESESGLSLLRRFEVCCYSGAACPQEVGDHLVANDVNLIGFLGSTEAGHMMDSLRDFANDKDWNVYRPSPRLAPHVVFENISGAEEGPFDMVIHKPWKPLTKHNRPDGSYASGDLFEKVRRADGSVKGYVYIGRGDDTLIHFSGEKTNPVPMEQTFRSSPLLRDCLVFGTGQNHTGALIIPYEQFWEAFANLSEDQRQTAMKKEIQPLIDEVNRQAPSHSRLVLEMIRFLSPENRFPLADKGSIKRPAANQLYSEQIGQLYSDFDLGVSTSDTDKLEAESPEQVVRELKKILGEYLQINLTGKEDVDLTRIGVDSLMDSQIRSKINRTFKLAVALPGNIVFGYPTLHKLAQIVFEVARLGDAVFDQHDLQAKQEQVTLDLYKALRSKLLTRPSELVHQLAHGGHEVVVLTGATGSLGAHILHQLALKPSVAKIVCLNRAKDHQDAERRTDESLRARGLPGVGDITKHHSNVVITSLAADLAKPSLGLENETYADLVKSVTSVVHNGWPVNFNMSVESFADALEGSVNLLNLVSQSAGCAKPRFLFSSSISVALRSKEKEVPEQIFSDLSRTMSMGYAQSKWIVEQLCRDAETAIGGVETVVMRIGQMVGDRQNGIWNETEAPPLMIKSAQTLGCLPDLDDQLYWLPVDAAGFVAAQLTSVPTSSPTTLVHVTTKAALPWSEIVSTLARPEYLGDSFSVVPHAEWVQRLKRSDSNPAKNPTIKLLTHFETSLAEKQAGIDFRGSFSSLHLQELFARAGLANQIDQALAAYSPAHFEKTLQAWKASTFLR